MSNAPQSEEMLLDFDGWLGRQDEETRAITERHLAAVPENRDVEKRKIASMYAVADATGLELGSVNDNWDAVRAGFAEKRGGDWLAAKDDEAAFHGQLVKEATQRRDERHLIFGIDDRKSPKAKEAWEASLANRAIEAAYAGKSSFVDALAEWQATAQGKPGYAHDRFEEYETIAWKQFERTSKALEKARPVAERAFTAISKGREGEGGDVAPFALFRGLSPEEKSLAFRLMTDKSGGKDKSRTQAFFEAIGRGFENMAVGGGTMAWIEKLNRNFKAGDLVSEPDAVAQVRSEFGTEQAMRASGGTGAAAAGMARAQRATRPLTEEEARKWNADLSAAREDAETAEELREFGQETIDPTNKTGGFFFRKFVLPAADSAALMASLAIPGGWAPALELGARQYQGEDYARLRSEGMAPEEAARVSAVSGAAQAALDKVEVGILAKGIPGLRGALRRFAMTGSGAARAAANVGSTLAAETAIELTQDHIIPALAQDILSSDPEFDVRWADVWSEAANAAPETAMGMVLLSGLGGVAQTRAQSRYVRELSSSPAAMTLSGYTAEQIAEIESAPLGDRGDLLAKYLPRKAPEGAEAEKLIADFKQRADSERAAFEEKQRAETAEASEAADYAIRVTRTDAGWQVEKADGATVVVDTAEAARRIRDDLRQAASQEEADALVAIIDSWHGKEGVERETTLTGEKVRATADAITRERGTEVTEIKDAKALDAIAAEARMDSQTTGDEEIDVIINGQNSIEFREKVADGAARIVQRLELNQSASSALTVLHEQAEAAWRTGVATGAISLEETQKAVASIASSFDPSQARDVEERAFRDRVQRVATGAASQTEIRETVSELAVADAISRRKDGGYMPAGAVSKALSAAIANARDREEARVLGWFRAFLRSAKTHFRAVLGTVAALRKAKRDGKGAEFQALIEKITGIDESSKYERELGDAMEKYVPPEGDAFSVTSANKLSGTVVADEGGKPLRVYHGTAGDLFKQFDPEKTGSERTGNITAVWGSFFTASPEEASRYAMMDFHGKRGKQPEGRRVIPVFLAIKNPYEMTRVEWDKHAMKVFRGMPEEQAIKEEKAFRKELEAEGFDGIIVRGRGFNTEYVAFKSDQIVSALSPNADAFSISPGKRIELIQKRIDAALSDDPERRRELGREAARKLQKLKSNWETQRLSTFGGTIRPLTEERTRKQLDKEQAVRQALREEELTAEGIASLSNSAQQAYERGRVTLEESPFVAGMLSQGKLLSKTAAARKGKFGEYDDSPGLPAQWSDPAHGLLPDEMAQYLYDAGLLREPTPGALWDALRRELNSARNANQQFADAEKAVRDIQKRARDQAKEEAFEWRREREAQQGKDFSPKARLVRDLRTLDAILSVLPPEIRGKVGGFVKLARLGSDEARLAEIGTRIEKISGLVERYLKKEYDAELKELFQRAKPKQEAAGKKKVGKAGADVHALFATLEQAKLWTPEETAARVSALETEVASGAFSPEEEAHKILEAGLVSLIGDWHNADAARRETAVREAKRVFDRGYQEYGIKRAQLAERREAARGALRADTGKTGLKSERDARMLADNGLVGGWKKLVKSLLSFEQLLHWTFGHESKEASRLVDMERKASFQSQDEIYETQNEVSDLFTRLAGGALAGEKLRWKMAQKSIEAGGSKWSELEAITATLMWRQPDGQRHMEGKRDENNQVVSAWGYDQGFIDTIEAALSPEARAVREFISSHYAGEYPALNRVYRELNGINLPSNPNYAPLTVKPQQAQQGQSIDPLTGTTYSTGSVTPGALRTRGGAVAEPDFRDALQVFIAHTKQMAHWKAYAPFVAEATALLNNREVGNSIEAKAGEQAVNVIRGWITYFGQGGTRDAAAHLELNQMISRMSSRAASVALIGRIGTLAIQSTQLAAGLAEMPTGAYMKRLGLLLSGNLGWGKALSSPYVQRRLNRMPPVVREALDGLRAHKPNMLRHGVQRMGELVGGADALFTAGTFAIVYDYQLSQAQALGLSGAEAEAHALQAAERATDRVAQPTRAGARSLYENTATNPFVRVTWAFASEARKNLGLALYALAERPLAQKARTVAYVAVLNSLVAAMIRAAWRDARDDDDDEVFDDRNWDLKRMALSVAVEPFQGIPAVGAMIQSGVFKLAGEWRPEGDLFSGFQRAAPAILRLDDMVTGEQTTEESFRDVDAILSGMGLFNEDIAASASLVHLARDLFGTVRNFTSDDSD